MEICCSCSSTIQAIRSQAGDFQVDKLSQGKSFLQVSNGNCLRKRASTLLEHQRLLSFFRCFARQRRVSRNGSRVILLAKWLARSAHKILMAWSSQPIGEEQHREPFIPSRSNKADVHFGALLFAFSPQRKQASTKPPKWTRGIVEAEFLTIM